MSPDMTGIRYFISSFAPGDSSRHRRGLPGRVGYFLRFARPGFCRTLRHAGLAALLLLGAGAARADVNSELNRFWNDLGGTSNVTGPTAFKGQAAGYYTMGNLRIRSGARSAQIASFSLPSVEAGCGGIDIFSGSLSIISADELKDLTNAIVRNAAGFALDLALETLSPVLAETMKDLRAKLQAMTQANIDSCETAAALVQGDWMRQGSAFNAFCAQYGMVTGKYDDYAQAEQACGTKSGAGSTAARAPTAGNADEEGVKDQQPTNINITWEVLKGDGFQRDWLDSDQRMAEMMMSLAGTVIIRESGDNPEIRQLPGRGFERAMIDWFIEGGTSPRETYRCIDSDKCLRTATRSVTVPARASLKGRVESTIDELIDAAIKGDAAPSSAGIALVNRTSLPLYRIINVYAAYSGPIIEAEREALVEAIAGDLALQFLNDVIDEITARAGSSRLVGQDIFAGWEEDLHRLRGEIRARQIEVQGGYNKALELVERVRLVEAQLSGRFGSGLSGAALWNGQLGGGR